MQTVETEAAPASSPDSRARTVGKVAFWSAALIVIFLDQATKAVVRTALERGESWPDADWPVKIRHITNSGAAFGILQDQTTFLIVMATVGLVAIYLYYRNPPFDHWIASAAIGLMLGGALGNLIDRVRVGRVTDFIDFDRYPAFNVADSAIFVGVTILIGGYLWTEGKKQEKRLEPANEDAPADG